MFRAKGNKKKHEENACPSIHATAEVKRRTHNQNPGAVGREGPHEGRRVDSGEEDLNTDSQGENKRTRTRVK